MQAFFISLLVLHLEVTFCVSETWLDPHDIHSVRSGQQNPKRWVDPHEMHVDLNNIYANNEPSRNDLPAPSKKDMPEPSKKEMLSGHCAQNTGSNQSHVYLKRLINLLLNSVVLDKEMGLPVYTGTIDLSIIEEDYVFLKNFADSYREECVITLQKVDTILSKLFAKPSYKEYLDFFSNLVDHLCNLIFNRTTIGLITIFLTGMLIYKIAKANFSFWLITKCLLLMFYIADFAATYLHLIEAEEIKNIVDLKKTSHIPPECNPTKMSWFDYTLYLFKSETDCLQYYKATHQNLYYLVTPIRVISHQFGSLVVGPISDLGTALGAFVKEILSELPWGLGYILLPIVLVFFCLLFMILCVSLFGCSIRFKIFPFTSFEFGNGKLNNTDTLSGNNLEYLLHTHRKFIEDIQEAKTTPEKEADDSKRKQKKLAIKMKKKRDTKNKVSLEQKVENNSANENNFKSDQEEMNKKQNSTKNKVSLEQKVENNNANENIFKSDQEEMNKEQDSTKNKVSLEQKVENINADENDYQNYQESQNLINSRLDSSLEESFHSVENLEKGKK